MRLWLGVAGLLWQASRGYRLRPWRSPYIRWRIETYSGLAARSVGFRSFWAFAWRERAGLWRYLRWAAEMRRGMSSGFRPRRPPARL